ncbi:hypothetical protein LAWI1_G005023 [Lachnellula willkommii]|uniref:Uncharacterized protein n=1 Tax=Lachnellula willkommii TaxID=215461 RepID=A0A559MI43_9HELO|nr:hypothetical protein LAWI1_G005023 [Lachnellula willkommii]
MTSKSGGWGMKVVAIEGYEASHEADLQHLRPRAPNGTSHLHETTLESFNVSGPSSDPAPTPSLGSEQPAAPIREGCIGLAAKSQQILTKAPLFIDGLTHFRREISSSTKLSLQN